MRTFSCFITGEVSTTPTLSLILADTEERARELARRELLEAHRPIAVELCVGGQRLWSETFEPSESPPPKAARARRLSWSWGRGGRSQRASAAQAATSALRASVDQERILTRARSSATPTWPR